MERGGPHDRHTKLRAVIDAVAHLLPAQGPISVFVHHNTLHAFENRPFDEAVVEAGRLFGCRAFLSEERYRSELTRGRITMDDIVAELRADLGERGAERVGSTVTRLELRRRLLVYGIPPADGRSATWLIRETSAGQRFRMDLPPDIRRRNVPGRFGTDDLCREKATVKDLWRAAVAVSRRIPRATAANAEDPPCRHRDWLLQAGAPDTDGWVHPLLIGFLGAFLDQGLAYWPMPGREHGIYRCFLALYGEIHGTAPDPRLRQLKLLLQREAAECCTSADSLVRSLDELGVDESEWRTFLTQTALALRGWTGLVRQIEERPDRAPVYAPPTSLLEFLAVRLLAERVVVADVARNVLGDVGSLAALRPHLRELVAAPAGDDPDARAWQIFHLAQILGLDALALGALAVADMQALLRELDEFDETRRCRVFHNAYERRLRRQLYDALATHRAPASNLPRFQAIFCIDEREESIRRHLEEAEPTAETFGTAGFFGVAMYYKGERDALPRPLCPVSLRPALMVEEIPAVAESAPRTRFGVRRRLGRLRRHVLVGSHTMVRGTIVTAVAGSIAAVPLVIRVLFPSLAAWLSGLGGSLLASASTRLIVDGEERPEAGGVSTGLRTHEKAVIVGRLLEQIGLVDRISPLVLVVGHGSTSLNNPHESAYNCGACSGGRGGPNARVLAQMANDEVVRQHLRGRGILIPAGTWFVAAEHDTCTDGLRFFDVDVVPDSLRPLLASARRALVRAARRNSHERCRRFESAPLWYSARRTLAHVRGRAADLAQPRPECGHATNAFCVVGRRLRTRGLFLDRRAFLVSYDPTRDNDGTLLAEVLAGVVPVVAGINLEYYFSYADSSGYGCGTKLPHNVASLLGVMEGAQSDLRTGLPWQMVEIHEPVRLTMVVEARLTALQQALEANRHVRELVANGWIHLAALDPDRAVLHEVISADRVEAYAPSGLVRHGGRSSREWYRFSRDHLSIAVIGSDVR